MHVAATAMLCTLLGSVPAAAQDGVAEFPRDWAGRPDLNGVWQAIGTAHWDIQDHPAMAGPAAFGAIGSVVWGLLAERIRAQVLLAINFFGNGLVFLLLFWTVRYKFVDLLGIWVVFFLSALHGFLYGGRQPMTAFIWAEFFGRKSLGAIFSFSTPFRYAANAVSPIFAAFCFDVFGSYAFPFYFFVLTFFIACSGSLYLKSPARPA